MGTFKQFLTPFLNKRYYFLIKTYSFYRKDFWGFLKLKRLYKYKKIIYSILKHTKKYYNLILYRVYFGIKFHLKEKKYRHMLMFVKKSVKLFYGLLKDSFIGKLGRLVKRKQTDLIDYFYALLERRIDVLLYRALYSLTVRFARYYIIQKLVFINNVLVKHIGKLLLFGDVLNISNTIFYNPFFFKYSNSKELKTFKKQHFAFFLIRKAFLSWTHFNLFFNDLLLLFFNYEIMEIHFFKKIITKGNKFFMLITYIYKFGLYMYKYIYYSLLILKVLQKKKKKLSKIKRKFIINFFFYKLTENNHFFKKIHKGIYILFCLSFLYIKFYKKKINKKLFTSAKRKRYRTKISRNFKYLYSLVNYKIRFFKYFFYLQPKFFNRNGHFILKKYKLRYFLNKKYRYWKFSYNVYNLLRNKANILFFYKGYLSYLEVNYKIHCIILIHMPKVNYITYPFTVDKFIFFDYFRRKSYF
jgi:ribosomal protein S4